ncbi:hypothetical protein DITRI_Ditri19aG0067100 [Diplodiscus trichospermus]
MSIPEPNLMENPVKITPKSKNYHKAKGLPFLAFLFSIVIYISVFYIFTLSPSTLFSNTKFWFVISNTLILIIAADYGAFSSSKDYQKRDIYEDYALYSQARRTSAATSSYVPQYPEVVKSSIHQEKVSLKDKKEEDEAKKMNEIPERILEVVKIEPQTDNFQAITSQQEQYPMEADNNEACHEVITKKKIEPTTFRRSKSDKVKRVTFNDKNNNLKRWKTEKHEPSAKQNQFPAEDQDEFSTMSDEELNRRVEEFIQNFNRQIRLQGC